jgi:hypothetical protein
VIFPTDKPRTPRQWKLIVGWRDRRIARLLRVIAVLRLERRQLIRMLPGGTPNRVRNTAFISQTA